MMQYNNQMVEKILFELQENWWQERLDRSKTMDSETVLQAIDTNPVSSPSRVWRELWI